MADDVVPAAGAPAPATRVSDEARAGVLELLSEHCGAGTLTLDEFSERCDRVLAARTAEELAAVTDALPALDKPVPVREDHGVRRVVAVLGTNRRRARWRVGKRATAVAVLGASWVDLRGAQLTDGELTVRAYSLAGTVKIVVPEGVGVELQGVSILGVQSDRTPRGGLHSGAPVIRVKGLPLLGSVRVVSHLPDEPPPRRSTVD